MAAAEATIEVEVRRGYAVHLVGIVLTLAALVANTILRLTEVRWRPEGGKAWTSAGPLQVDPAEIASFAAGKEIKAEYEVDVEVSMEGSTDA